MTKVTLVVGGNLSQLSVSGDYLVGVDRACLSLLKQDYRLDMAVGDFDSVSLEEKELICRNARLFVGAPAEKDDTDTELALKEIFKRWPEAEVTVYGGFGGRLDHELSNLFLPSHPAIAPYMEKISLCDKQNHVTFYPKGRHEIARKTNLSYVSFLLEGQGQLRIQDAKYHLTEKNYFQRKIYSSNEFMAKPIQVTIPDGYLVVIESGDGE